MLAICAALWWEIGPVLEAAGTMRRFSVGGVRVWRPLDDGNDLVVFRTGVGPARAAASVRTVLDAFPLSSIVNTGSAGGLVPGLARGALVVPSTCYERGEARQTDPGWTERLRRLASSLRLPVDHGTIYTSPAPLLLGDQKRDAHRRWRASAVDMESAAVARVAAENGVAFAVVRSILDPVEMEIRATEPWQANMDGSRGDFKLSFNSCTHVTHIRSVLEVAAAARTVRSALRPLFTALLQAGGRHGKDGIV